MCSIAVPEFAAVRQGADFSLTFPPEPRWVRGARDAVRTALAPVVRPGSELVETAALLTSEVVTNAVTASRDGHSADPVALYAEWSPAGGVRVLVRDGAPGGPPAVRPQPDDEAEHGRGLLLMALFASDWGVCRHLPGRGKVVWFTLAGDGEEPVPAGVESGGDGPGSVFGWPGDEREA
ncbi:ATP-binding protein [Streptomyces sp. RFCAC02]|uniref:ATP-binding protein n=1 Tax=Streptomyces sp. RFCAC02 TaxID=2499143 RepID=UPI001021A4F1|nr:ATP-binding protein [Streptomyces sp. RFCAC02]